MANQQTLCLGRGSSAMRMQTWFRRLLGEARSLVRPGGASPQHRYRRSDSRGTSHVGSGAWRHPWPCWWCWWRPLHRSSPPLPVFGETIGKIYLTITDRAPDTSDATIVQARPDVAAGCAGRRARF